MPTPSDPLDALTRLAGRVSSAPMSAVMLGRLDQPTITIRGGLGVFWTAGADAAAARHCRRVLASREPSAVPGVWASDGEVGACLGVPILATNGDALGAVSVFDRRVRGWHADEIAALGDVAIAVACLVEARQDSVVADADGETERRWNEVLMTVAHDLAQPLQAARAHAQLLRRGLERGAALDRGGVVATLTRIESSAARIGDQIAEVLDVAHARSGQRPTLRYGSVDLVEVVRQAVAAQQGASGNHTVALATAEAELVARVDAARIRRAVDNLLDNAVKYSPGGGAVILTLEREDGQDGPVAVVAVRDQGVGVPSADLPRLGERFFRAANAVLAFPGTGIGLAGARQTAEAHGGTLCLESTEGVGTVATLRLPLGLAPAEHEPARPRPRQHAPRRPSRSPSSPA